MNTKNNITEHNKKKKWVKPELRVLGMNRTFGGQYTEPFEVTDGGPSPTLS